MMFCCRKRPVFLVSLHKVDTCNQALINYSPSPKHQSQNSKLNTFGDEWGWMSVEVHRISLGTMTIQKQPANEGVSDMGPINLCFFSTVSTFYLIQTLASNYYYITPHAHRSLWLLAAFAQNLDWTELGIS